MLSSACADHCFFFNDTATTEIYTLSLHDALPISILAPGDGRDPGGLGPGDLLRGGSGAEIQRQDRAQQLVIRRVGARVDRKSTRLNSSHANISYAVFCLKKKTQTSSATCSFDLRD